jgi:ubiquinone/menaquinone biosynthesis C-methylase UbiE
VPFATARRYPWRPFRFKVLSAVHRKAAPGLKVLDVGCGNHSPATTKLWWPHCEYSGLDRSFEGYSAADLGALDHAYRIDCSSESLSVLPDASFDVIIVSHVLEHLANGLEILKQLATKLTPGGYIYVESPSARSLELPSMPGCLNFYDDATHLRVYELSEISNVLLENRVRVVRSGARRDAAQILSLLPVLAWKSLRHRPWQGSDFWDLVGFANFLLGRRM